MATVGANIQSIRQEKAVLNASLFEMIASLQHDQDNEEWINGALEVFKRGE